MPSPTQQESASNTLAEFNELIANGSIAEVRDKLTELHPAEVAHLLESLPREDRIAIWDLVESDIQGEVLLHVIDDVRSTLIRQMDKEDLISATEGLETDDLADFLPDLPPSVSARVLQSMDEQHRQRLEAVMSYPEDTAGGLMNTDTITIRPDISLEVVQRYLRLHGEIPEMTDNLIVVNRDGKFLGSIALTDLLVKDPTLTVAEIINRETDAIPATMPAKEVANLFERRDLVSAPVVDDNGLLLGRITIDDVVDVIRDEADHSLMSMAGLNEEDDMFAPVITSSRRRTIWLGLNLVTALLASWVIGQFEDTIQKLVALAVLMPIVASMGGIAGSQTLTIVIRAIALGKLGSSNARRLLLKELFVGFLNGLIWALIVGGIAIVWFDDDQLGLIIAIAMLANLIVAALAGASIPLALKKFGIDPALAGGVLLTTVTDVIGFLAFLGLAAAFLV
jgi:magnesium transporter